MHSNVLNFPAIGKAITLEDQGVYFTMNATTGMVHSIFRLDFESEWYLHQLKNIDQQDEFAWVLMAEHANDALQSMPLESIQYHFNRPEFAQHKGNWQVIRNNLFGFGKFTPTDPNEDVRFALIPFVENEMRSPIHIVKADEETLHQAEQALDSSLEMA